MSKFDDLLAELQEDGLDAEIVTRLREASSGSPLRREKDEALQRAEKAEAEAAKFRSAALGSAFAEAGIKAKPEALNIPEDLDPLDKAKVTEWAVGSGLIEAPPTSEEDQQRQAELDAMDQVAAARTGAGQASHAGILKPEDTEDWPADKRMRFMKEHPEAAEALKRGEPVKVANFA